MISDSVFHSIVVVTIIIIQYVSGFVLSRLVCWVGWAMIREISRDWPSHYHHHQNNRKVQLIFYNCGSKLVPSWSWSVSWSPGEAASPGSKGGWFETTDHHRGWREVKPREPGGEMTIKIYSFLFSKRRYNIYVPPGQWLLLQARSVLLKILTIPLLLCSTIIKI